MVERSDWPQTLNKPMLANFKDKDRFVPHAGRQKWQATRSGMSPAHLALLRQLPCTVCHERAHHAHHLRSGVAAKERGVGIKATDRWAVGLCFHHHDDVHRVGSRQECHWFSQWAIDPHLLANALWAGTGDLGRMGRILLAHKLAASRELTSRRKP